MGWGQRKAKLLEHIGKSVKTHENALYSENQQLLFSLSFYFLEINSRAGRESGEREG
jgi:hypothetical protein